MATIEDNMERAKIKDSSEEKRPDLKWQLSTLVSNNRASLMPAIAENFKNIIADIGEDGNRAGLVDTPRRAAQALLFFTKGYEDR